MGTSAFRQGASLDIDGKSVTLLKKVTDQVWQVEDVRTGRIVEYIDADLRKLYAAGRLVFATGKATSDGGTGAQLARCLASDEDLEIAKVRRLYAKAVFGVANSQSALTPVIQEVWQKLQKPKAPPSWMSVFRWKKRFQDSGNDVSTLVDNKGSRGNRTKRYPTEVQAIVESALNDVYLRAERKTIQDTIDHAVAMTIKEN